MYYVIIGHEYDDYDDDDDDDDEEKNGKMKIKKDLVSYRWFVTLSLAVMLMLRVRVGKTSGQLF